MILSSPKLSALKGIVHGFSTRLGGVSQGPYRTLNLGTEGDVAEALAENRRRFALYLGLEAGTPIVEVKQVHKDGVLRAPEANGREADGIIATEPGALVGVRTADCAPILIACTDGAARVLAVAAVHAGWRGATAQIAERAVGQLASLGAEPARMVAAVGPTIGLDAFEVGPEVIEAARASLSGSEPPQKVGENGRPHLDLPALVVMHLQNAGLDPANIERVGGCTFENRAMYFSHRRDRGVTGRQLSAIGLFGP